MSNLICPLTFPEIVPPQATSGSYATLHVQTGLARVSNVPRTQPRGAVPQLGDEPALAPSASARCSVKACVFPAASSPGAKCRYHALLESDAYLFQSHQPSHLMLLYAPFGVSDHEPNDFRQQDRKRQAAERESFILDESAEEGS
jgi:hypothetical protein